MRFREINPESRRSYLGDVKEHKVSLDMRRVLVIIMDLTGRGVFGHKSCHYSVTPTMSRFPSFRSSSLFHVSSVSW